MVSGTLAILCRLRTARRLLGVGFKPICIGKNAKSINSSNRNVVIAPLTGAPNFEKLKISNKSAIC